MLIVLYGLLSSSILLSVALAVAWHRFGRELHAALWSLAYGLAAASWTFNLLKVWLLPDDAVLTMLGAVCTVGSFALIALGFRRRAALPLRIDAIVAVAGVTIVLVGIGLWQAAEAGVQRWLVLFYCAGMLMVSAFSLRDGARGPMRASTGGFWLLASFAAYVVALGILSTMVPSVLGAPTPMLMLFRLVLVLGVPTGLFGIGLFAMFLLAADLADGMRELASSDPLTAILNRRGLEQAAEQAIAICRRGGRPLAVVVADIDHFKRVNDHFGHAVGDQVLRRFADHAGATVRQGDLLGRLGGEEFVFVLPDTTVGRACEAIERFRLGLSAATDGLTPQMPITASFGIAAFGDGNDTLALTLQRADLALYRSKLEGRDRITVAPFEVVNLERLRPIRAEPRPRRAAG